MLEKDKGLRMRTLLRATIVVIVVYEVTSWNSPKIYALSTIINTLRKMLIYLAGSGKRNWLIYGAINI